MVLVVRATGNGARGEVLILRNHVVSSSDKSGCFHFSKRDLMF